MFTLTITCLGLILVLSGCGLGKDAVTDTNFKVDLKKATDIYAEETGDKPLLKIAFDTKAQDTYQYIFTNETEVVYIDAQSGNATKENKANELGKNESAFATSEVKELGKVNTVLEKAKKDVGGLSPRILTWELSKKENKLVYTIDVKTTTSDKVVTIDAN